MSEGPKDGTLPPEDAGKPSGSGKVSAAPSEAKQGQTTDFEWPTGSIGYRIMRAKQSSQAAPAAVELKPRMVVFCRWVLRHLDGNTWKACSFKLPELWRCALTVLKTPFVKARAIVDRLQQEWKNVIAAEGATGREHSALHECKRQLLTLRALSAKPSLGNTSSRLQLAISEYVDNVVGLLLRSQEQGIIKSVSIRRDTTEMLESISANINTLEATGPSQVKEEDWINYCAAIHALAARRMLPYCDGFKWFDLVVERWKLYAAFGTALGVYLIVLLALLPAATGGCMLGDCTTLLGQVSVGLSLDSLGQGAVGAVFFALMAIYGLRIHWFRGVQAIADDALQDLDAAGVVTWLTPGMLRKIAIVCMIVTIILGVVAYLQNAWYLQLLWGVLAAVFMSLSFIVACAVEISVLRTGSQAHGTRKSRFASFLSFAFRAATLFALCEVLYKLSKESEGWTTDKLDFFYSIIQLQPPAPTRWLIIGPLLLFAVGTYCIYMAFGVEHADLDVPPNANGGSIDGKVKDPPVTRPSLRTSFYLLGGLCALITAVQSELQLAKLEDCRFFNIPSISSGDGRESVCAYHLGNVGGRDLLVTNGVAGQSSMQARWVKPEEVVAVWRQDRQPWVRLKSNAAKPEVVINNPKTVLIELPATFESANAALSKKIEDLNGRIERLIEEESRPSRVIVQVPMSADWLRSSELIRASLKQISDKIEAQTAGNTQIESNHLRWLKAWAQWNENQALLERCIADFSEGIDIWHRYLSKPDETLPARDVRHQKCAEARRNADPLAKALETAILETPNEITPSVASNVPIAESVSPSPTSQGSAQ